jgi:hypothetical protein
MEIRGARVFGRYYMTNKVRYRVIEANSTSTLNVLLLNEERAGYMPISMTAASAKEGYTIFVMLERIGAV